MNAPHPLDAATLADYWLGLLPASEEASVEEHLMECDDCGTKLREIVALADGVRALARAGSLRMVVSDPFVSRAAADGVRVRAYDLRPDTSIPCTVTADDDLLIARLVANLSGATRVDLCMLDVDGVERHRMTDIPFDAASGTVIYQESMTWAKAAPTARLTVRLVAVDAAGHERLIGEYSLNHTRSLPGPGAL
jgi:putative zinc finger protein